MDKNKEDFLQRKFSKHQADRRYAIECLEFIQCAINNPDFNLDAIIKNVEYSDLLSNKLKARVIAGITEIKTDMDKYEPEVKT